MCMCLDCWRCYFVVDCNALAVVATANFSSCDDPLLKHCGTAVASSGENTYWQFGDHVTLT